MSLTLTGTIIIVMCPCAPYDIFRAMIIENTCDHAAGFNYNLEAVIVFTLFAKKSSCEFMPRAKVLRRTKAPGMLYDMQLTARGG